MMDALVSARSSVPARPVFHYTSQNGLLGITTSKAIWATNILYLNDAAELRLAATSAQEQIPRLQGSASEADVTFLHEINRRLNLITEFNMRSIYVCSFCESGDQLSLWRGYCPNGNGFSIGFDFASQTYERIKRQDFDIFKCVYDPIEQSRIIEGLLIQGLEIFHKTQNAFSSSGRDISTALYIAALEFDIEFLKIAPILKHAKFSEEQEWRLISKPIMLTHPQVRFREGNSMIIPYFQIKLAEENEPLSFPQIFVGPAPHPFLAKNAVDSLLSAREINGCSVQISEIPYRAGGLQV